MRSSSSARRVSTVHHVSLHTASHRSDDPANPFRGLMSSQFQGMYVRNPVRNQYRRFMRAKTPYRKPSI